MGVSLLCVPDQFPNELTPHVADFLKQPAAQIAALGIAQEERRRAVRAVDVNLTVTSNCHADRADELRRKFRYENVDLLFQLHSLFHQIVFALPDPPSRLIHFELQLCKLLFFVHLPHTFFFQSGIFPSSPFIHEHNRGEDGLGDARRLDESERLGCFNKTEGFGVEQAREEKVR